MDHEPANFTVHPSPKDCWRYWNTILDYCEQPLCWNSVLSFLDIVSINPDIHKMAFKGSKVTTRQHSKQSKTDGASINMEDSILISEEDLDEAPLWGRPLSQNFKELSVLVNYANNGGNTFIDLRLCWCY